TLQHVQEEQLNPLAERLLDKILLTPGEPLDWGNIYIYNDEEIITGFGLGYIRGQSQPLGGAIDPYVLDQDKVARMAITDFQLSPSRILKILGLTWDELHPRYGFRLRIVPALNITITPTQHILRNGHSIPSVFNISVKSYDGYSAANAKVKVIYLVLQMEKKGNDEIIFLHRNDTVILADWMGKCSNVDFNEFLNSIQDTKDVEAYILLVYASYYGIRSFNQYYQYSYGDILESSIIGNYLVVKFPKEGEGPKGARHIRGLLQIGEDVVAEAKIDDVNNPKTGESKWIINKGNYDLRIFKVGGIDPWLNLDLLYVFWAPLPGRDRYCLVVVNYPPIVDYSTIGSVSEGLKISIAHRYCRIGSLTYVAELQVWRMAE
ncbi:MAG: hypothetical protein QXY40_09995, partial [Candidatus Methanomethylicia archaeon]